MVKNFIFVHFFRFILLVSIELKILRSHRYDLKRPRHRHKYARHKKCPYMIKFICIEQYLKIFEIQLMKKLRNTDFDLKKDIAYKKN